jgi:drug/metabolite transporter (DMT)-like permease
VSGRARAILGLILVMVIWGSAFSVTKAMLTDVPPILLALLRFTLASILLSGIVLVRWRRLDVARLPWGTLALMGLTGVGFYYLAFNMALSYTTASQGVLIQGATPAVTALGAALLLKEHLSARSVLGIGVSTVGVILVVLSSPRSGAAPDPVLGAGLMFIAVLLWAGYTLLAKRAAAVDQLVATAVSQLIGTLTLLPLALIEVSRGLRPTITSGDWLGIIYLGALSSAAGYLLYNWSLTHLDASRVGNFTNLMPIVGVAVAILFLGESLAPLQLIGGLGVLIGVGLSATP